jgi:hypothetical protein
MKLIDNGNITEVLKVHNTILSTDKWSPLFMVSATMNESQVNEIKELCAAQTSERGNEYKLHILHETAYGTTISLKDCYISSFDIELTQQSIEKTFCVTLSCMCNYWSQFENEAPTTTSEVTMRTKDYAAYDKAMGVIDL